jgi:predicted site-specific integrase-resolvase
MGIDEAIAFFGTGYKLCKTLGISRPNITYWRKQGYIPYAQQLRIEELTQGKLKLTRHENG